MRAKACVSSISYSNRHRSFEYSDGRNSIQAEGRGTAEALGSLGGNFERAAGKNGVNTTTQIKQDASLGEDVCLGNNAKARDIH